jgi:hypothetical protein
MRYKLLKYEIELFYIWKHECHPHSYECAKETIFSDRDWKIRLHFTTEMGSWGSGDEGG